jgi:Uma2 family endonuclease
MPVLSDAPPQPIGKSATVEDESPDTYITLSGIDWATFEGIADRTRGGRITYHNGELEIMSPSIRHEDFGDCLRELVSVLIEFLGIEYIPVGSTTWKTRKKNAGKEADSSFYFEPAKLPAVVALKTRGEKDITKYPAPDLVIEIDMRPPSKDRLAIIAKIGAVELWEFDGKAARIRRLGPKQSYVDVDRFGWVKITASQIVTVIRDAPPYGGQRRPWMRNFVAKHVGREES